MTLKVVLKPLDSWFFRDSTPFHMDASPQAGVRGVFPPSPSTVAGAMRAALARTQGWDGSGSWSEALKQVLGDGPEHVGQLGFKGPFVVRDGEPVFPIPRHLLGQLDVDGNWISTFVRLGDGQICCDLGRFTRLPEMPRSNSETRMAESRPGWITPAGLRRVLDNQLPAREHMLAQEQLWQEELHVGIRRNPESRTTDEGALYSTRHARLNRDIGLGVEIRGLPDDWAIPPGALLPLGGESRLAECSPWKINLDDALALARPLSEWITLIALTPVLIEQSAICGGTELLARSGLRVVCACVDRPLRVGGWDSLARRPLALRNALRPGSVLFCHVDDPPAFGQQIKGGVVQIGEGQSLGFGLFAVGETPR